MGGANHIGFSQKSKLKIKWYFVVKILNLELLRLNLWLGGLNLTQVPHGLAQN
jgi:hypothetical protein